MSKMSESTMKYFNSESSISYGSQSLQVRVNILKGNRERHVFIIFIFLTWHFNPIFGDSMRDV